MNEYDEVKGKIERILLDFPSLRGKIWSSLHDIQDPEEFFINVPLKSRLPSLPPLHTAHLPFLNILCILITMPVFTSIPLHEILFLWRVTSSFIEA